MFGGPRFMIRVASLEMHPVDTEDRLAMLKDDLNLGMCNITKCCTEVCPEHIEITDNGIIPLKERVVDRFYDPFALVWRKLFGKKAAAERTTLKELPVLWAGETVPSYAAFAQVPGGAPPATKVGPPHHEGHDATAEAL